MGCQEDQQVDLLQFLGVGLERPAQAGDIPEVGHLELVVPPAITDQAAHDHRLAVVDHDGVFDFPVEEGDAHLVGGAHPGLKRFVDLGQLLEDLQAQGVPFADLGRDAKGDADVLPFDVDRTRESRNVARGRVDSARDDGNVVADTNFGLFIIRGEDVGCRDDIQVGVLGGSPEDSGVVRARSTICRGSIIIEVKASLDHASEIARTARNHGGLGRREKIFLAAIDHVDGPLHAKLDPVGDVDLDDQGLDQHLGPGDVELLDHRHEGLVGFLAGLDHQGIGGGVGAECDAFGEGGDLGAQVLDLASRGAASPGCRARAGLARKHAG